MYGTGQNRRRVVRLLLGNWVPACHASTKVRPPQNEPAIPNVRPRERETESLLQNRLTSGFFFTLYQCETKYLSISHMWFCFT